jgi:pimeloyl-ACP methyl ester carboxylesterase
MTTTTGLSYDAAANQVTHADNGIDYGYREIGTSTVPLVLLQHFRGNLDYWDPPLVDAVGAQRCVIAFDNVGVGATTGITPNTIEQMARDAINFLDAVNLPLALTSWGSRSAASLPRRSLSSGLTWYAGLCWPPPRHEAAPECTAGPRGDQRGGSTAARPQRVSRRLPVASSRRGR